MQTIGLILLPGTRIFDFAVACEVWGFDRKTPGVPPFDLRMCAPNRAETPLHPTGSARATHGLSGLDDADLVIVAGNGHSTLVVPDQVKTALRKAHRRGATIAALCSGAFVLATAGLLDGRKATTHWALLDELAVAAPKADIQRDMLYTEDDGVLTSAGVVGGLDLCMHLLRRDFGAQAAASIARRMVMPPFREGGQAQYVEAPMPVRTDRGEISATVTWALTRLGEPISVTDLAEHARMSERGFHRAFVAATGTTPGRWLLTQRVRHAQRLLETSDLSVDRVAHRSGLGTSANLRRRMRAELGTAPGAYRRTFRAG